MDHNQDLLLSDLNLQKKDNIALQAEITIMTKRMAKVTYANNLYHVYLIEHNCTLPEEAEHLLSSWSSGGQAEYLQAGSSKAIMEPSKKQDATYPFQKLPVDTKTIKKDQLPEDHHIFTLFPTKETTKTPKIKNLVWINMMSKVLARLEKKFSTPIEKRKKAQFRRKPRSIKHLIPKKFTTTFHLLAALSHSP
jgi:hypothetical protein